MAYGVTLPVLPFLLERVLGPGEASAVSRHTGWLTGLYTFAAFLVSPAWGVLSDRAGRRSVLVIGLVGSAAGLVALDAATGLGWVYTARIASGLLSSAVLPAALAFAADSTNPAERPRYFAMIASATTLGFLLGPVIGSLLSPMLVSPSVGMHIAWILMPDSPLFVTAVINLLIVTMVFRLPGPGGADNAGEKRPADSVSPGRTVGIRQALLLTMLAAFVIGVVEVGMTLAGKEVLFLGPRGISAFFLVCSVVMVGVQIWVFPPLLDKVGMRRLVSGAFMLVAGGQIAVLGTMSLAAVGTSVAFVAVGVGILIPALGTLIAAFAGSNQGWALGRQSAAVNLGQAIASALAGVLFVHIPAGPFLAAAAACLLGVVIGATVVERPYQQ